MASLVDDWNSGLGEATAAVEEHNQSIMSQVDTGMISPEQASQCFQIPC